ncbi:MAG: Eco57I restriction-modification methylase domain-containing protein [Bacteroidetes bacterium]|nr:Eco57I restriction-modification methylase domain-containing protein [Bacteroidota bacterium]
MKRINGRNDGEVYTRKDVVAYILDESNYKESSNLGQIKILEPAAGGGAFVEEILRRLFVSSQIYNFSFTDALLDNVRFIEINPDAYKKLVLKIRCQVQLLTDKELEPISNICILEDFLLSEFKDKFNCIVGNPPYVRHERIANEKKTLYKRKFKTFKHRADLYIPFFEKALNLLKTNGTLCYICSNRWINNEYGKGLRELIAINFNLIKLLNIERTSPFDEDVIAYPCIATIRNDTFRSKTLVSDVHKREVDFDKLNFVETQVPKNAQWHNLFISYDLQQNALTGIKNQGFEIGIGVATGADKVFILNGQQRFCVEESRLLPVLKSSDLKNDQFVWGGNYVINPYENGSLCRLDDYPMLKGHFYEHKLELEKRHVSQKVPQHWYKTIDKIKPSLKNLPKILLPDLTANKFLFIDEGNYYPHHNLYYITGKNIDQLKLLACILMSDFVRNQISKMGIRMNGGLPRFQAQVLKKLKIPRIDLMGEMTTKQLISAYDQKKIKSINKIVNDYIETHQIYDNGSQLETLAYDATLQLQFF